VLDGSEFPSIIQILQNGFVTSTLTVAPSGVAAKTDDGLFN
jgi:hypothetical protein